MEAAPAVVAGTRPARLDPAQPAATAWIAAVETEATTALAWLQADNAQAVALRIHQARRACKRLRALLRLAESAAPETLPTLRRSVAAAARALAPGRDAQVAADTLDDLVERYAGALDVAAFAPLQRRLRARAPQRPPAQTVEDAIATLNSVLAVMGGAKAPQPGSKDLHAGLLRAWRRARSDARLPSCGQTTASWHRLRSRVLVMANQLAALRQVTDGALRKRERRMRRLAEQLGSAHDRAVLRARVCTEPLDLPVARLLDVLLLAEEEALYRQITPLVAKLFDRPTRPLKRRLQRHWRSGD